MRYLILLLPALVLAPVFACSVEANNNDLPDSGIITRPNYNDASLPDTSTPPGDATTSCESESSSDFCRRFGQQCGDFAQVDSCGYPRATNCGSCRSDEVCQSGTCQVIPDNCVPEKNAEFCARFRTTCGSLTNLDNCGKLREDVTCKPGCNRLDTCVNGACVECKPRECKPDECSVGTDGCDKTLKCCAGCDGGVCLVP